MQNTAKEAAGKEFLMWFEAHLDHKPLQIRPRWKFIWEIRWYILANLNWRKSIHCSGVSSRMSTPPECPPHHEMPPDAVKTHQGRFLGNLVTFLVGRSCVRCDKMWLLSASQHHFPATYQIEFKELTMTTVIVDNKVTTFRQNHLNYYIQVYIFNREIW